MVTPNPSRNRTILTAMTRIELRRSLIVLPFLESFCLSVDFGKEIAKTPATIEMITPEVIAPKA
jgi:hypothetical protein